MNLLRGFRAREVVIPIDTLAVTAGVIDVSAPAMIRLNGMAAGGEDFGGFTLFYIDECPSSNPVAQFFPNGFGYLGHAGRWFIGANNLLPNINGDTASGYSFNFSVYEGVTPELFASISTANRASYCGVVNTSINAEVLALSTGSVASSYNKDGTELVRAGLYSHIIGCRISVASNQSIKPIYIWQGNGQFSTTGHVLTEANYPMIFGPESFSPTHPVYIQSDGKWDLSTTWYLQ